MRTKQLSARIACSAAACTAIAIAGAAHAQDPLIENLKRNIAEAEQTMRAEPYLASFCGQLRDQKHFFHRGRYRQGKNAVVSLDAWAAYLKRLVEAGQINQARAEQEMQSAQRRRNEVVNACALDYWRAELARVQRPPVASSAPATFAWNASPEANFVINGAGTLTGDFRSWQFTGQGTPSWDRNLRASIQCAGQLDPGVRADPGAGGKMKCRATWTEKGKSRVWECAGPGTSRAVWSIGEHWFGMWPRNCVGTATSTDGSKNLPQAFGLVGLQSRLGTP